MYRSRGCHWITLKVLKESWAVPPSTHQNKDDYSFPICDPKKKGDGISSRRGETNKIWIFLLCRRDVFCPVSTGAGAIR